MAILKHIASKNANYNDAVNYMKYQYNELTMKPIRGKDGYRIFRDWYKMDVLNCRCPETFYLECKQLNDFYHKNQMRSEIKSHHYVISFDPKDQTENGLTSDRAQALALEYAKRNFPGHQALICTHLDGNNGSGNIHSHIIINSLRKLDVEQQEFMERSPLPLRSALNGCPLDIQRPCDSRAGYKHHLTKDYLRYLRKDLMNLCERENLHQVDLLAPAQRRITDSEYRAGQRGQKKLDTLNQEIIEYGLTPRRTKFQTQKQFLRDAIEDIAATSKSFETFQTALYEKYKIKVTDRRGRYSYLHPKREKNITDRALGTLYESESLLKQFRENAIAAAKRERGDGIPVTHDSNASRKTQAGGTPQNKQNQESWKWAAEENNTRRRTLDFDADYDYGNDPFAILYIRSNLRLVTDLQDCTKAKVNRAYAQKVKISNLQKMARTIAYVQEQGYGSRTDLRTEYECISQEVKNTRRTLRAVEAQLKEVNRQIHYTGQYLANKDVYRQMLNARSKEFSGRNTQLKYLITKLPSNT
ncbi:MAG: relaxase/mobilization nuclease domain-containing protein [Lachnospiraceae bacterium]|nr:relaxase/mobilization nuclease domain-containing protein [Lachnospiraceae bacterium]